MDTQRTSSYVSFLDWGKNELYIVEPARRKNKITHPNAQDFHGLSKPFILYSRTGGAKKPSSEFWGRFKASVSALTTVGESLGFLEAHALYNYKAQTSQDISFEKGDTIILFKKVNYEWWEGSVWPSGQEGFIPHKYIEISRIK